MTTEWTGKPISDWSDAELLGALAQMTTATGERLEATPDGATSRKATIKEEVARRGLTVDQPGHDE